MGSAVPPESPGREARMGALVAESSRRSKKRVAETDPEIFDRLARSLPDALREAQKQRQTPPGTSCYSEPVSRRRFTPGPVVVTSLLKARGKGFSSGAHSLAKE